MPFGFRSSRAKGPDGSAARWARGCLLGLATGLGGALLAASPAGTAFEETLGLSWLFNIRGPIAAPPDMAVVTLDRATAETLQLSHRSSDWPRTLYAEVVDSLTARGASVIVFDMMFDTAGSAAETAAFAEAVARAERVVLFQPLRTRKSPVTTSSGGGGAWLWRETLVSPVRQLAVAARALAPFPLPKVPARVSRFWSFKPSVGDAPTLPVAALQVLALPSLGGWAQLLSNAGAPGADRLPMSGEALADAGAVRAYMQSLRHMFLNDPGLGVRIRALLANREPSPESRLFAALAGAYAGADSHVLNFYGPAGSVRTIPYHLLRRGEAGGDPVRDDLAGACVFVGVAELYSPEQQDAFHTVYSSADGIDISGVEIAATAFGNLLTGRTMRQAGAAAGAVLVLALGIVVGAVAYVLPAATAVPAVALVAGGYVAAAQLAFNRADLWLPLATPVLVQLPFALLVGVLGQYLLARRQRARAGRAIRYFVPEAVAAALTERDLEPSALNRVVYAACLASDAQGYTAFSEKLEPTALALIMKEYFDALAEAVRRHDVDVWAFVADSLMCAWTAAAPDIAVRRKACLAALDARAAMDRFARERTGGRLMTRIGLHDGQVQVGPAGGGGRFVYNVTGDPANTAARIQNLNKRLHAKLLASMQVVEGVDEVLVRPLGDFQIVGKAEPIAICEIITHRSTATAHHLEVCERFEEALDAYRQRQWTTAEDLFAVVLDLEPHDGPSRLYRQACKRNQMLPRGAASTVITDSRS